MKRSELSLRAQRYASKRAKKGLHEDDIVSYVAGFEGSFAYLRKNLRNRMSIKNVRQLCIVEEDGNVE